MTRTTRHLAAALLLGIGCAGCTGKGAATPTQITDEAAGEHCPTGGVRIDDGSGAATYVCNGQDSASGVSGLPFTVTTEAPGASCANGGFRVDDGSGVTRYVCNAMGGSNGASGSNGQSPTVTAEAPGTNCATGGFAITAPGGAVTYLCNGRPAPKPPPVSLCPADTLEVATASFGIFVELQGQIHGAIQGDAGDPVPNAIAATATCYSARSPAPTRLFQALVIVSELDRATPRLYTVWIGNEHLSGAIKYFDRDAMGAPVLANRIDLTQGTVASLEQITAEDPAQPGVYKEYLRTTLTLPNFTETPTGGTGATAANSGYNGPAPPLPCAPAGTGTARMFMQVTGQTSGVMTGDATNPLAPDWIEVLGTCHLVSVPIDMVSGMNAGVRQHMPLIIVKPEDSASVPLLNALFSQETLTSVQLMYVRTAAGGADESYFTVALTNAHVVSEEAFAQGSTRMDRMGFKYQTIEWTWFAGGISAIDSTP